MRFSFGMQRVSVFIVSALCLAFMPLTCHAEQTCAWLNAATAGGFLEGDVTSTVTLTSKINDDMTCEFVRQDGQSMKLRIEVDTVEKPQDRFASYVAKCGKNPASVQAVGNEAMICSRKEKNHETTEHLIGRVRDRIFLLDISSNAPHPDETALREKATKISQQVAGILF